MEEHIGRRKNQEPEAELDELRKSITFNCVDPRLALRVRAQSELLTAKAERKLTDNFENLDIVFAAYNKENNKPLLWSSTSLSYVFLGLKMLPEGFGNPSGTPQDGKEVIYAIHQKPDTEENRLLYKYTHNNFNPGERIERKYRWPAETKDSRFRFGHGLGQPQAGAGARLALNWEVEDDGSVRKTRLVQKNAEDFRNVHHTKVYHKSHPMQGANGPPLDPDFRHGVKSGISDYTAKSCIQGYYSLEEQLPDQDLGRCLKPGRRNVTVATRAFGVPSVRTDIPAPPPDKRSIADNCSYGDECSAAALLNPQRFDDRGDELRALVESCDVEGVDFDALWEESVPLFDDGLPLVSLDAMLFVHTKKLEDRVAALHTGTGPGLAAYKGAL
eukprot:s2397_g12.t2